MARSTRRKFLEDSMLAAAAVPVAPSVLGAAPLDGPRRDGPIRVAVIGVRGRGRGHVGAFKKSPDAEVVAFCDADKDPKILAPVERAVPKAKFYQDIRALLEDDSIEAVSIATPNHWHSLAAIWALQAGKHVYVEKPISHNVREGRAVIEAAKKAGKLVQHGTQARSSKATRDAMAWLQEGGLGKVKIARALCYKRRGSIGKVDGPQQPPATCDYDLWTGPAEMQPLMRRRLHYDWHWVFNTGNGDIGNQGVHQMDIARWGLGRSDLPKRVVACGGRLGYEDDGNTPNTLVSLLDYGDQQLIFEVRGLKTGPYKGAKIGVVFHCEKGYLVSSSYGRVLAFDHDGQQVKEFRGGGDHFQNFLDAVKTGKADHLNADVHEGHLSAALCHLGNIPYMLGTAQALSTDKPFGPHTAANESFERCREHLLQNGLDADATQCVMGPTLHFKDEEHGFAGPLADKANALLTRQYRKDFAVG